MSEKRILLASLLKPVNDTRMYGKLGLSLSKLSGAHVHIAGFEAPLPKAAPANIHFHPVFSFKRISINRFTAHRTFWNLLTEIKPDLLIVGTHELLLTAWLYTIKYKCKLVYDVRENYKMNLTTQDAYPAILKNVLGIGVRSIEYLSAKSISHFLLAEQSYADELSFVGNRYTVIENKYKPATDYSPKKTPVSIPANKVRLLMSGTISEVYGVFEAIKLADEWHEQNHEVTLTIIGYCAQASTLQKLKNKIAGKPYIRLIGGDKLVPHTEILQAIASHDLGLLPYRPNPSTIRCIPTKLYEYMAYGLPVLMQDNPLWESLIKKADAGLTINFKQLNINPLLTNAYNSSYYSYGIPEDVFWESEEQKLFEAIKPLLKPE